MFLNEKCKYLCIFSLDYVCSYTCLKNHFNIHNTNGCLACEDFECKYFEEMKE